MNIPTTNPDEGAQHVWNLQQLLEEDKSGSDAFRLIQQLDARSKKHAALARIKPAVSERNTEHLLASIFETASQIIEAVSRKVSRS